MQNLERYIERDLEREILACLDMPEIIAVVGPRQSGKTTLLQHIVEGIKDKKVSLIDSEDRDELALFANDIKGFCELHVEGEVGIDKSGITGTSYVTSPLPNDLIAY